MLIVKQGTVIHSGKKFVAGEIVTGTSEAEAERLIRLGACVHYDDPAPAAAQPHAAQEAGASETATPTTPGINLNVNPADVVKAGKK